MKNSGEMHHFGAFEDEFRGGELKKRGSVFLLQLLPEALQCINDVSLDQVRGYTQLGRDLGVTHAFASMQQEGATHIRWHSGNNRLDTIKVGVAGAASVEVLVISLIRKHG